VGAGLLVEPHGSGRADNTRLLAGYNPQPSLEAGNRATAPSAAVALIESMFKEFHASGHETLER
jgi:hypothetical protein